MANEQSNYDPHSHRCTKAPLSDTEVFINLLKGAIGTGCLAMPRAYAETGWLLGLTVTFALGVVITYALNDLISCMYILCVQNRVPTLSYTNCMKAALHVGPRCLRPFKKHLGYIVDFFLVFYHFGVCCVYIIFVANNLKQLADLYYDTLNIRLYIVLLTVPLILTYIIKSLKYLVPLALVSVTMLFLSYMLLFVYIFDDLPAIDELQAIGDFKDTARLFGTIMFAIESVGLLVAVEANMEHPKHFLGIEGILASAMFVVITFYAFFGFVGYWSFGNEVAGSIVENIPINDTLPQVVTLMFAIGIFLSYPLQGYVTNDILWNVYLKPHFDKHVHESVEYIVRIIIVLTSVLCAVVFPDFRLFLNFVGSFSLSYLGLIFPGLIHLCVYRSLGYGRCYIHLWSSLFLILIGIVGGSVGSWLSINQFNAVFLGKR